MNSQVPQWIAIALGSGVISGLIMAGAEAYLRRGERSADVRERRRQEAAQVVGPVFATLRDVEP